MESVCSLRKIGSVRLSNFLAGSSVFTKKVACKVISLPRYDRLGKSHAPQTYSLDFLPARPLTRAAGGMSYALMLHPRGLPCGLANLLGFRVRGVGFLCT